MIAGFLSPMALQKENEMGCTGIIPGAIALTIAIYIGHFILNAPVLGQLRYLSLIVSFFLPCGAMLGAATIFSLGDTSEKEPKRAGGILKFMALLVIIPTAVLCVDAVIHKATLADMVPAFGFPLIWAIWIWRRGSILSWTL